MAAALMQHVGKIQGKAYKHPVRLTHLDVLHSSRSASPAHSMLKNCTPCPGSTIAVTVPLNFLRP